MRRPRNTSDSAPRFSRRLRPRQLGCFLGQLSAGLVTRVGAAISLSPRDMCIVTASVSLYFGAETRLLALAQLTLFAQISLKRQLFARPNLPHQAVPRCVASLFRAQMHRSRRTPEFWVHRPNAATTPNAGREACIRPKHVSRARSRAMPAVTGGEVLDSMLDSMLSSKTDFDCN